MPANVRLLRGNPARRPIPEEIQPEVGNVPEPPEFLNDEAKGEWRRVSVELYRLGILTVVDIHPLAAYCQAFGRWVVAERALARMAELEPETSGLIIKTTHGNVIQNPLVGVANKAATDMVKFACQFGLTPSARASIAAGVFGETTQSKFQGLLAG